MARVSPLIIAALLFFGAMYNSYQFFAPQIVDSFSNRDDGDVWRATVKIANGPKFGSGFHIGQNKVVTAWHVMDGSETADIITIDGREIKAKLVWSDKEFDLAILQGDELISASRVELACRDVAVGEVISAIGSPYDIDFAKTFGRIAADARRRDVWADAFVGDIVVGAGMSGGPVFDKDNYVIGVTVGVLGGRRLVLGLSIIATIKPICKIPSQ